MPGSENVECKTRLLLEHKFPISIDIQSRRRSSGDHQQHMSFLLHNLRGLLLDPQE
jgi:hypothetical protein